MRGRQWIALGLWAGLSAAPGAAAPLLQQDFERLCRPASLGLMAAGLAGAGIAHQWDDQVKGQVGGGVVVERLLDLGNIYGSSLNSLGATIGVWALARETGHPLLQATASEMARSAVLAGSIVQPLKRLVNRRRPDGSDRRSFPSGHAASAFAMSTALARRCGARARVPLYALTLLTPLARIHDRRHYLSDVVAGGAIGVVAGCAVTQQPVRVAWAPAPGGWVIEVVLSSK